MSYRLFTVTVTDEDYILLTDKLRHFLKEKNLVIEVEDDTEPESPSSLPPTESERPSSQYLTEMLFSFATDVRGRESMSLQLLGLKMGTTSLSEESCLLGNWFRS